LFLPFAPAAAPPAIAPSAKAPTPIPTAQPTLQPASAVVGTEMVATAIDDAAATASNAFFMEVSSAVVRPNRRSID